MALSKDTVIDIDDENRKEQHHGIESDFRYQNPVANCDIVIRMGFLRKVFGILSTQLFLTVIVCAIFQLDSVKTFALNSASLMFLSICGSFGCLLALMGLSRRTPHNYYLLFAFTILQSISLAYAVAVYNAVSVLLAAGLTLIITVLLMAFTLQSKRDFSSLGSALFVSLFTLVGFSIISVFFNVDVVQSGIALAGALLFSLFIIFDTHMLMRKLSAEDYIVASVNLYLDMINLFLYLLRLFGSRDSSN